MSIKLKVEQRTPAWLAARRELVTGTDIAAILGVSPWKSEADVAADKAGEDTVEDHLRLRLGGALEPFIAAEFAALTGRRVTRAPGLYRHAEVEWAGASLDYVSFPGRRILECKNTSSRSRFADGLPQDVEAQVRWQLGVTGLAAADVAVLVAGERLDTFEVVHDADVFAGMVAVAADFRRRLAAGGPFEHSVESVKRAFPQDDGSEIPPDPDVVEAVATLITTRTERKRLEESEAQLEAAIKARMGSASVMRGPGWDITWRRTKDRTEIDWKALAADVLPHLPGTERDALLGRHEVVRPGFRPFRVAVKGDPE